jgi:hypothetical protein
MEGSMFPMAAILPKRAAALGGEGRVHAEVNVAWECGPAMRAALLTLERPLAPVHAAYLASRHKAPPPTNGANPSILIVSSGA